LFNPVYLSSHLQQRLQTGLLSWVLQPNFCMHFTSSLEYGLPILNGIFFYSSFFPSILIFYLTVIITNSLGSTSWSCKVSNSEHHKTTLYKMILLLTTLFVFYFLMPKLFLFHS
jgi:hypothetical protein